MRTPGRWHTPLPSSEPASQRRPPFARLRVGETVAEVEHGGIVGGLRSAALRVVAGGVSEAHAMVSFRKDVLVLLGLRGRLEVDGAWKREALLQTGATLGLAAGVVLEVLEAFVPTTVLTVAIDEHPPEPLVVGVYSILDDGVLACEPGFDATAAGQLLWTADGWTARLDGGDRALRPRDRYVRGDHVLRFSEGGLGRANVGRTTTDVQEQFPVRLVARYDTVHLHRADLESIVISGVQARIISELVGFGVPAPWEVVAREIWKDRRARHSLRKNWDRHIGLLRKRLDEAGYASDLVRPDGHGHVELFTRPDDQVIDQT